MVAAMMTDRAVSLVAEDQVVMLRLAAMFEWRALATCLLLGRQPLLLLHALYRSRALPHVQAVRLRPWMHARTDTCCLAPLRSSPCQ